MVQKIITFNVALKSTERQWVQKIPEVYTNDLGSVSIQFNITDCTDTELTGSSAIVLLKMRDGSFFQRPSADVSRTLNVFSYTLKENEGNHDGLAEIQLIVSIAGKEFATQKYQFKVNSGLDSEVAREIMIYDWTTLTAEARAYIDQFTADEMVRDAKFDNAQFDRNVDFEVANTARNEAFTLAQTQRNTDFGTDQAARVLAFNNAETARVNAFNLAEAARAEGYATDHACAESDHTTATSDATLAATDRNLAAADHTRAESDHTRADADHTRAESDHTRADADSATVGGYNARLTDVEVDTSFDATNLVTNGDFSNGTTGWSGTMLTVTNGVARLVSNNIGGGNQAYPNVSQGKVNGNGGSKYYIRALISEFVQVGGAVGFFQLGLYTTTPTFASSGVKSHIMTSSASFNTLYINHTINAGASIDYRIDNIILIDLTATFGAGNEPTAEQMDAIMATFGNSWFDGTKNLFQAKASLNKLMAVDARTEFEARNLVVNGDFSNGTTTGWLGYMASVTNENKKLKVTATVAGPYAQVYMTQNLVIGNKYYIRQNHTPGTVGPSIVHPVTSSARSNTFTATQISTQIKYSSDTVVIGDYYYIDDVILIDLTATFGAGKEPTVAEMDRLMARFPNSWFDGVKPIQTIETLYQEKANKVQEAWITPTLLNGAVQHATRPFQYRRTTYNSLQFRGEVSNCPINNVYITILADGYRPASNAYAVGNRGNTFAVVSVLTNGSISMNGTNATFALFDNIEIPLD